MYCSLVNLLVTAAAGNDIDIVAVYSRFQEMKFPALYIVDIKILSSMWMRK